MGIEMEFYEVGKRELCEHECDTHSLTRTRTLKGGWFGLTLVFKIIQGGYGILKMLGASSLSN